MKQVFVFFTIILALISVVKAEEKSWYEIDGIRIRYGQSGPFVHIAIPKGSESYIDILKASKEIKSHQRDSGAGEFPYENPMIPLAIEWPEALMGKYSFRGGTVDWLDFKINDLAPVNNSKLDNDRITHTNRVRNYLKSNFFNNDDLEFVNSNPNWSLSADVKSNILSLGYYWGLFYPISESNRLTKIAIGLHYFKNKSTIKLNLCSEYIIRDENNCIGKKLIDSIEHDFEGGDLTLSFVGWENYSKDSIWRILSVTLLFDGYHPLKVKNRKSSLFFMGGAGALEAFSYTFRF